MTTDSESRWWSPSTTITDEGRRTRSNLQTLVVVLIVVGVLGWALAEFGRDRTGTGPDGSMFVTDVNGTAALADLLDQLDHTVIPVVVPFSAMDPGGAVFVIDPSVRTEYTQEELDSLDSWIMDGGRLIFAGRPHPDFVGRILPDGTDLGFDGRENADIITSIRGVDGKIETGGVYSVKSSADGLVLAGEPAVVEAYAHGDGEVVFIADSTILRNRSLESNAPWVVSLVPDGAVRFDEVRHGFVAGSASENPTSLLLALPEDVRHVILLMLPVIVLGLIVFGRRFGPPEATERTLAPPRRELVDAVAGLFTRMEDSVTAAAPISQRLRSHVARQAGLANDIDDDALLEAAAGLGVDAERLRSALDPHDDATIVQAQQLLAELFEREHK